MFSNKNIVLVLIIGLFIAFSIFIYKTKSLCEVIDVISPTKLAIDLNKNKSVDSNEIICINNIVTFSINESDKIYEKYSKTLSLTKLDVLNMSYLAQDYAQKNFLNKKVKVKNLKNYNSECSTAELYFNGVNYVEFLRNSGYALSNGQILNKERYNKNLALSKKLNLVILNHHSNKFHKIDCKYAKLAHDTVLIPYSQLPKSAVPCKFCHNIKNKLKNNSHNKRNHLLAPKLIHTSGNITLYYNDFTKHLKPDCNCQTLECKALVKLINNSKSSIDIAIYGYEDVPAVTLALSQAQKRGVKIRFVFDEAQNPNNTFYKGNYIIEKLASVSLSDAKSKDAGKIMHNKFIIIDNNTVYTGSMNFSKTGLSGYDQNDVIIITNKDIAELYLKEFEQMLAGSFHTLKHKHNVNNVFKLDNTQIEVYFSPQDKSSYRIINLINNAKKYIYLPTFLITHTKITNALISAHKRGVDVKIIMDGNNTTTRNTKHQILRDSGILLKVENYAGKLHSKTMIIDDEYIIMGSMNFSNSGENKNDENLLVIKNPQLSSDYKKFFLYLWDLIPEKYLKIYVKSESPDSIGSCNDGVDNDFDGKIDKLDEGCK